MDIGYEKKRILIENYSYEIEGSMKTHYKNFSERDRRRYVTIEVLKLGCGSKKHRCNLLGRQFTTLT